MSMYKGFETRELSGARGTIHARIGGEGPPLLLLHGFPETHLTWHAIAPALAERFTVVAADLPGYGASHKPPEGPDHAKRAVARDLVEAMAGLGHARFRVAGHDRGGRVAYRMALDHPDVVTELAILDIIPTTEMWARANARFAREYWHWGFLALPAPAPETMLLAAPPETLLSRHMAQRDRGAPGYPSALVDAYLDCLRSPEHVAGMCRDYRAGATIDVELDDADRAAGARIGCPTLVLWGAEGQLPVIYGRDILSIWRPWVDDLRGRAVPDTTHFLTEDGPDAVAGELLAFFSA